MSNIGTIRLILSITVVLFHISTLTSIEENNWLRIVFNGHWAVEAFFVISGLLIPKSAGSSIDLRDYFIKRFFRVFPLYFLVITITTILASGYLAEIGRFSPADIIRYFSANILYLNFLAPKISGIFTENFSQAINGALWTLKIEIGYYMIAPLLVFAERRFGQIVVNLIIALISLFYREIIPYVNPTVSDEILRQLPGQLIFFCAGRIAYLIAASNKTAVSELPRHVAVAATVFLLSIPFMVDVAILRAFCFAAVVLMAITRNRNLDKFLGGMDLSYSIYLVHFPLIQFFIAIKLGPAASQLIPALLFALLPFSLLCWNFVEKPFIKLGQRLAGKAPSREAVAL